VTLSSFGASPVQEGALPAISAEANFGAVTLGEAAFEVGALAGALAGFFAFFSCLTGSAAQVTVGLIAARLTAKTPIAIVILRAVAECMIGLRYVC
jgi:hypothetical protein